MNKKENNTTSSRESEMRSKTKRKTDWAPPSSLDAPPAPQGMVQRWIRAETMGFMDSANVSKALREGWEFVKVDQVRNEIGDNSYPFYTEGKYEGCIGIGGLVLARIPEEILVQRAEYFRRIIQDRMNAVDNDLMKEQHPDMPINIDRQSKVTFGGSRKK